MALNRFKGAKIFYPFYKLFTCAFKLNNGPREFIQNKQCYKIHCFDQEDDIVDIFSSHHHEVAKNYSRVKYDTVDFRKFYDSLKYLFEIERELFHSELVEENQTTINDKMYEQLDEAEKRLDSRDEYNPILAEKSRAISYISNFD